MDTSVAYRMWWGVCVTPIQVLADPRQIDDRGRDQFLDLAVVLWIAMNTLSNVGLLRRLVSGRAHMETAHMSMNPNLSWCLKQSCHSH